MTYVSNKLLLLPLVDQLWVKSSVSESVRMNENELPHRCGLAIEVFCIYLALGVSFRFAVTASPFRCRRLKSTILQLVVIAY